MVLSSIIWLVKQRFGLGFAWVWVPLGTGFRLGFSV